MSEIERLTKGAREIRVGDTFIIRYWAGGATWEVVHIYPEVLVCKTIGKYPKYEQFDRARILMPTPFW